MGFLKRRPRGLKGGLSVLVILVACAGLAGQLLKSRGPDAERLPISVIQNLLSAITGDMPESTEGPRVAEAVPVPLPEVAEEPAAEVRPYRYGDGDIVVTTVSPSARVLGAGRGNTSEAAPNEDGTEAQDPGEDGLEAEDPETPDVTQPGSPGTVPVPASGANAGRTQEEPKPQRAAAQPDKDGKNRDNGKAAKKAQEAKKADSSKQAGPAKKNKPAKQAAPGKKAVPQKQGTPAKAAAPPAAAPKASASKAAPPEASAPSPTAPAKKKAPADAPKSKPQVAAPAPKAKSSPPAASNEHLQSVKPKNNIPSSTEKQQERPPAPDKGSKGKAAGRKG